MYRIETERGDLFDVNMMITIQATVCGNAAENELIAAFHEAVASFAITVEQAIKLLQSGTTMIKDNL